MSAREGRLESSPSYQSVWLSVPVRKVSEPPLSSAGLSPQCQA